MRLCLSCYHMWPGDALLCGHCGRSFGGRLCARRHRSPTGARCCVQCGLTELTVPTRSLPLGWLPVLLSAGILLLAGLSLWRFLEPSVLAETHRFFAWLTVIAVIVLCLPGGFGRRVRRSASRTLSGLWRLVFWGLGYRLARELVRGLASATQGRRRRY